MLVRKRTKGKRIFHRITSGQKLACHQKKKIPSAKPQRIFHRITSGQKLARYQHKKIRFLTLTTSNQAKTKDLSRDIDVLIKRIRRKQPNFQYIKLNTNEGNGVIHLIYKGKYITKKWLVWNWNDIHASYIVDIQNCDNDKNIASYLLSHYLSSQKCSYTYMSYSKKWLFPGAIIKWKEMLKEEKDRYYYNPVQNKYYYKRTEILFKEILSKAITQWNNLLYQQTFTQTALTEYG